MIESVALINLFNGGHEYLLKIYTKRAMGRLLRKEFFQEWEKTIFLRKRRVEAEHKEIRIYLRKGDNIQKYIDSVSRVLCKAAAGSRLVQDGRNKPGRNWVLKRDIPAKTFFGRQQPNIAKVMDIAAMS